MKSTPEGTVLRLVTATGVASIVTQLAVIREFLAQFDGNEFVIALILFGWLALGAVGTLAAHLATGRLLRPDIVGLAGVTTALAALPTLQLLAIRLLRPAVFLPGTSVGFYPLLATTLAVLAPYTLLVGFALPYSLLVLRSRQPDFPGARIYIADCLGDAGGGVLFSFALVHLLAPLAALALCNAVLLAAALALPCPPGTWRRWGRWLAAAGAAAVLSAGWMLETRSLTSASGQVVAYRETPYGRLTVHRDGGQVTLFADGLPVASHGTVALAEEMAHFALAQPRRAERVLLVSTVAGMLAEVAKHRPRTVELVELDPAVTDLQIQYGLIRPVGGLARVHEDARRYLRRRGDPYDAIIVNLPEPGTFQLNRFYTREFFQLAADRLSPGGVLAFAMEATGNYLGEAQRRKLTCLRTTAGTVFRHVLLLPGQRTVFLCRQSTIHTDIARRLENRRIATAHIRYTFAGDLTAERVAQLNALTAGPSPVGVNTDLAPGLIRLMMVQWFARFATSPLAFGIALTVLAGVFLLRVRSVQWVLLTTGFAAMGTEMLVIFAFQIYFGYVYLQIGLIVTAFLAGLLPGALLGHRLRRHSRRVLVLTEAMLAASLPVFAGAVTLWGGALPPWAFLLFGLTVSILCGCQFPAVLAHQGDGRSVVVQAFSVDLAGAALGILVTSVALMPYIGLAATALALAGIKALGWLAMGGLPR